MVKFSLGWIMGSLSPLLVAGMGNIQAAEGAAAEQAGRAVRPVIFLAGKMGDADNAREKFLALFHAFGWQYQMHNGLPVCQVPPPAIHLLNGRIEEVRERELLLQRMPDFTPAKNSDAAVVIRPQASAEPERVLYAFGAGEGPGGYRIGDLFQRWVVVKESAPTAEAGEPTRFFPIPTTGPNNRVTREQFITALKSGQSYSIWLLEAATVQNPAPSIVEYLVQW